MVGSMGGADIGYHPLQEDGGGGGNVQVTVVRDEMRGAMFCFVCIGFFFLAAATGGRELLLLSS